VGIDLRRERVPDGTTLLRFRHLLEQHQLGEGLFAKVGEVLQARGMKVGTGTIVDATIIGAPSSTKNADKQRDPDMHRTRKGQQYFAMKMHIGVDSRTGLAHSAVVTAANVHDKHPLPDLLHGNEQRVYGDSAYASQKALIGSKAPKAKDFTNQRVRRGGEIDEVERAKNRNKSKIRDRVEHVFAVVKRLWGFIKVRYRGLAKNATRAFVVLGLSNISWRDSALWRECVCCARRMRKQGQNGLARARKRPNSLAASRVAKQHSVGLWNRHLFSVALSSKQNGTLH
jgi:IS5 family transposase